MSGEHERKRNDMNKAARFLTDCGTFYLATVDGDRPRVRPFGAVAEWEGRLYLCTSNTKDVFAQVVANPKVEISGTIGGDRWIRLSGKLAVDSRREARKAFLDANPALRGMYGEDDGRFEVLYFTEGTATFCSFASPPETMTL